jgi:hypothetical protein
MVWLDFSMGSTITTLFVSYSHKNERWLRRLLVHLKPLEREGQIDVWADTRLKAGSDWAKEIESALARAQVAVVLVSADFLASDFITSIELPSLLQSAERRACKVIPIIVGSCLLLDIQDLQRFQAVNSPGKPLEGLKKAQAEEVLANVASAIKAHLSARRDRAVAVAEDQSAGKKDHYKLPQEFFGDAGVDQLIKGVRLADWGAAEQSALQIIAQTDASGRNGIFAALLDYQDCGSEDEHIWGALHTIECCVRLAPWLITHSQLSRMAAHENFSVRSAAASICMDLAS